MDIEDIAPGQNFAETITQTLDRCSTLLVIVGMRWREMLDRRSAEQQPDYVLHEIGEALQRKVNVIPVLVGGASLAQLNGLPDSIAELAFHQAVEIRDTTFKEDCGRLEAALRVPAARTRQFRWIAAVAGLSVLALGLAAWFGSRPRKHEPDVRVRQLLNTARTQVDLGEHERAFRTYQEALRIDPSATSATDGQLDAAMLWAENFRVTLREGQQPEAVAGPPLSDILSVLEAGLARTASTGSRAADILAHIGWVHWLNRHIAEKEFGPAAEQAFRRALAMDPSNVYANAMLGNWLLQTGGSLEEALGHFDTAVKTSKQRVLVRQMQLGGMIYNDRAGVPPELVRVANQMRINGESMEERHKRQVLTVYSPVVRTQDELAQVYSALQPADGWATYLWLDDRNNVDGAQREFVHAGILEAGGDRSQALDIYQRLRRDLERRNAAGSLAQQVDAAVKRLAK
jgi:tetratricopeptide (TPR) repeat protein